MAGRRKERVATGLLAIFVGSLGVHQFYLGSVGTGIIIFASNLLCGLGFIIGVIEGILLLTMTDEEFDKRYNQRTPESVEFVFMKPKS